MKESIFAERVTQLVAQTGMSEYKVSHELGQCKTYIGKITSRRMYPSMGVFFAMCEYFGITPVEFFAPSINDETVKLLETFLQLSDHDKATVVQVANAFLHKEKNPIPEELKSLTDSDL